MSIISRLSLTTLIALISVGCAAPPVLPPEETATPPASSQPIAEDFQGQILPITASVELGDNNTLFELEVAETPAQKQLGLMYREYLPDNRGMLFEFDPPSPVRFWMKNCLISLDMLFIEDGIILGIAQDVPPCEADPCPTYGPGIPVSQVVEIRGGLAAELGIEVGDQIEVIKES